MLGTPYQPATNPRTAKEGPMIQLPIVVAFVSLAAYVLLGNFVTGRL
ncbi:hypothetical protein [Botrimarina colliarenosi]|nr:hypothetical protein [Botrimarina colliarenosi]